MWTGMTMVAYGVTGIGGALCMLLLSGVTAVERIGVSLCSAKVEIGPLKTTVTGLCFAPVCGLLIQEFMAGQSHRSAWHEAKANAQVPQDRLMEMRTQVWRHERNFW
eukprot:CAMPEP_0204257308 /NCGR_PEP_ID=MMETSP0468-20130131/4345_1 /ASSEMBLY_ACC=CAM_ASM_000383 /TAXON_ID=2969 /ORGANISM="Oxyrrhis marina" /LENGTH=106 /DNA_ID=CAMNT_0051231409 /DNA_START=39 /DNA_END=356 /DNA_ORIENTATION=-